MSKVKKLSPLTPNQARFIKNLKDGHNKQTSAVLAGYSPQSSSVIASELLRKTKIMRAMDRIGLTDNAIAKGIKENIDAGTGVKATASDSLKGLELTARLKGHLDKEPVTQNLSQTNVYIKELNQQTDKQLQETINSLQDEITELK